jgi:hypothetical protein
MQWDLGLQGVGTLAVLSLVFGIFTQVVFWGMASRWLWLVAALLFFVGGLFISEVWFGSATEAELQPNVDGLSFDEVLLAYVVGVPLVLAARVVVGRRQHRVVS